MTPPVACEMRALTPPERSRQKELLDQVRGKIRKTIDLGDGYELSFAPDRETVLQLAEWITLESRCCRFAAFSMEWSDQDTVRVRLSGPPGSREVLAGEMGIGSSTPRA